MGSWILANMLSNRRLTAGSCIFTNITFAIRDSGTVRQYCFVCQFPISQCWMHLWTSAFRKMCNSRQQWPGSDRSALGTIAIRNFDVVKQYCLVCQFHWSKQVTTRMTDISVLPKSGSTFSEKKIYWEVEINQCLLCVNSTSMMFIMFHIQTSHTDR